MSESSANAVEVRNLVKIHGAGETAVTALRGVSLDVARGEFVAVVGRSGSGKSTLLHLLAGLDRCTSGTIRIGSQQIERMSDDALTVLRRREVGLVFQAFNLLEVLTAEENVALPLVIGGIADGVARRRAKESLERVGLAHRAGHLPKEMSGGEQQRVAIARALVTDPILLLADEPTGNLDSVNGDQVMTLLRNLVRDASTTILMVTHDGRHAGMADRTIELRDGRVVEASSPLELTAS